MDYQTCAQGGRSENLFDEASPKVCHKRAVPQPPAQAFSARQRCLRDHSSAATKGTCEKRITQGISRTQTKPYFCIQHRKNSSPHGNLLTARRAPERYTSPGASPGFCGIIGLEADSSVGRIPSVMEGFLGFHPQSANTPSVLAPILA